MIPDISLKSPHMCTHIHVPQYTHKHGHKHVKMEKEEEREIPCDFTNLKSQIDGGQRQGGGGELMFNRDDFSLGK